MAVKKARLKMKMMSMSRGSTALIVTPSSPPASLAAAAVVAALCSEMLSLLPADASVSGLSPALFTAVATPPLPLINTVVYDSV
ncbi:hypothetical protein BDFG_09135 [Blastomyces dermatitidis ATCC 26199]|nr:hypothetical protein BDFG_09135 [Blastomyces dermatitidis ATCC 26199]